MGTVTLGTEAGKKLLADLAFRDNYTRPGITLNAIAAIEAEAGMNGWNLHIEQLGDPDRAAFMEGYRAAVETIRERLAARGGDRHVVLRTGVHVLGCPGCILDEEAAK